MSTLSRYALVIDDEEPVREAVIDILTLIGLHTFSASNGTDGIRLFRQFFSEIALVVLDLHMPHMSGRETFRQLRQIDPDVRVIFSSGYEEAEIAHILELDGSELQSVLFLQKPYVIDTLLDLAQQIIKPSCAV